MASHTAWTPAHPGPRREKQSCGAGKTTVAIPHIQHPSRDVPGLSTPMHSLQQDQPGTQACQLQTPTGMARACQLRTCETCQETNFTQPPDCGSSRTPPVHICNNGNSIAAPVPVIVLRLQSESDCMPRSCTGTDTFHQQPAQTCHISRRQSHHRPTHQLISARSSLVCSDVACSAQRAVHAE